MTSANSELSNPTVQTHISKLQAENQDLRGIIHDMRTMNLEAFRAMQKAISSEREAGEQFIEDRYVDFTMMSHILICSGAVSVPWRWIPGHLLEYHSALAADQSCRRANTDATQSHEAGIEAPRPKITNAEHSAHLVLPPAPVPTGSGAMTQKTPRFGPIAPRAPNHVAPPSTPTGPRVMCQDAPLSGPTGARGTFQNAPPSGTTRPSGSSRIRRSDQQPNLYQSLQHNSREMRQNHAPRGLNARSSIPTGPRNFRSGANPAGQGSDSGPKGLGGSKYATSR